MTPIDRMSIYTRTVSAALHGALSEHDRKLFSETFPERIEQLDALNNSAPRINLPSAPTTEMPSAPIHVNMNGLDEAIEHIVAQVRRAGYPI